MKRNASIKRQGQAIVLAAAAAIAASAHATAVSWSTDASGLWITAADWSSNPSLPGSADDVTINQPGAVNITLSSGTQSINSLVEDNTLTLSAGILNVATTLQVNGVFDVSGGTLQTATLSTGVGGAVNFTSGIFDGVTLASSLPISTNLTLKDGLTFSNSSKLSLNNASNLLIGNNQTIGETDGGTGIVEFDGTSNSIENVGGTTPTLTIGSGVTVQTGSTSAGTISVAGLTNQGLISAQTSGKTLTISSPTLSNSGTIQALNGGTLNITTGTLTTTQLGNFSADPAGTTGAGTIQISGTLNNTGSTLALSGPANSLLLTGAIVNGTVSTANGAALTIVGGTLDGVTLASSLSSNSAQNMIIKDGLTFLNSSKLSLNNASNLLIGNNQTIGETDSGTGIVEFDGTADSIENLGGTTPTLTIGSGVTVQTGSTSAGTISVAGLTNQGLISAQTSGKTLTISSPTLTNSGTIQALNGGTLNITTGTLTTTQLGNFNSDPTGYTGFTSPGTIQISGTLNNTGSTLALSGPGNSLSLTGTIMNGTVSTASSAVLTITSGTFDGVTLASSLPINSGNFTIKDGLTFLDSSKLSLNNASNLLIGNNQTIGETDGGTGIVEFDGTADSIENVGGTTPTLTIGPGITVQTGTINAGAISTAGLINQSTISAQASGKTLTISSTTFNNTAGTIQALNGGTLNVTTSTLTTTQLGSFSADPAGATSAGTIQISGTLNNTGSTLALSGAGDSLLVSGTVMNGTVLTNTGLTLTSSSTFDGVILAASLPISANLTLKDGLTFLNSSKLSLNNASNLLIGNNQTIGGTGIVEFDGTADSIENLGGTTPTLTIGSGVTVQTASAGTISVAGLTNQGLISAQTSGKTLSISSPTLSNSGTIQALNSGILSITNSTSFTNSGNFTNAGATSANTINNSGNFTQTGTLTETGNFTNSNMALIGGTQTWSHGTTFTNTAGMATFNSDAGSVSASNLSVNITAGSVVLGSSQHWAGLTTSNLSTLGFALGSGAGPEITNGNLLTLKGSTTVSIGSGTLLSLGGTPVGGDDYRLIGDQSSGTIVDAIPLANFSLSLPSAPGGLSFSLSNTVDPGFIDLVVATPANLTWNNAGGASPGDGQTWDISNNKNWNNGTIAANVYTNGANVTFNGANNSTSSGGTNVNAYNVTLNTTVTPASIVVNNSAGNYTISGSGAIGGTGSLTKSGSSTLILATPNTYSGGTIINGGTLVIGPTSVANTVALPDRNVTIGALGELQLADNAGASSPFVSSAADISNQLIQTTSLSIATGGVLDIRNNHFNVADPGGIPDDATFTSLYGYIQSGTITSTEGLAGYGIGLVDGNDSVSGSPVSSGQIEVAYTLEGDANLDGKVDATDFGIFAPNFGATGFTLGWEGGDFNYDGKVDATDFGLFAPNFGQSDSGTAISLPSADYAALDAFAAANGLSLTSVPEPASAAMMMVAGSAILRRRRRQEGQPA